MKISAIIPTYNRPESLGRCLDSFVQQRLSKHDFEVVVVDDGSRQPLDHVIEAHGKALNIKLIRQSNQGPASARNRGVKAASGEFVAFTDDDCQADRGWLLSWVDLLQDEPNTLLGGQTVNHLKDNIYSEVCQLLIDYLYEFHEQVDSEMRFFTTNNMALSRQAFLDSGGFDEGFAIAGGEDREFCDRWQHFGKKCSLYPNAIIYHSHPLNLAGFCKLHYRYGQGAKRFWENRIARGQTATAPNVPGFYIEMLKLPWKKPVRKPLRHSALLTLSQLTGALGYFSNPKKRV